MEKNDLLEKKLKRFRKNIDRADKKIIAALAARHDAISEIGRIKAATGMKVLQSRRMKQVIESRVNLGLELGLDRKYMKKLYNVIHDESVRIQQNMQRRKKK